MKYSIRELILVTVIVALALGWLLDHLYTARAANEQVAACEKMLNEAVEEARRKPISELEREAINYKERRDVYRAELVDLIKITHELADEPGYEKLKARLKRHDRDFTP